MQSVWSESVSRTAQPALEGEIKTDVLVIGGGMAGALTAHRLKNAGIGCVIAEAKTVGDGVTKNTTAKITAQHGLIYADIIKRSGIQAARLYLDSNTRSLNEFYRLANEFTCDFEGGKTAFVYSTESREKLEREAAAYHALGLPAQITEDPPLPIKTAGALAMENQAQFNPLMFLYALTDGLAIYENTPVLRLDGSAAITPNGKIIAKHVVIATHFPLVNIPGLYFIKLYQHRSYVVALRGAPMIDGMYVDERKDGHSFRTYRDLLLIGGGDHKTGKKGGNFSELRALAAGAYPDAAEAFAWATQDCMTLDGLPYAGRHRAGAGNLYVASGFNKWGMTGSMTASMLLCDLILHGKSGLSGLYSPQRSMLRPQLAVNLAGAVAGLASAGGPRCAHMGCKLHCHGSRFNKDGSVIDNPAKRPIRM
jgi:glycine/D-amino acid oxidase-like deaminating enzyme